MDWTVNLIISFACLGTSIVAAAVVSNNSRIKPNRFFTPFNIFFLGLIITTFVLMLPIYRTVCAETRLQPLKTVLFAIHETVRVFKNDSEPSLIINNITESVGPVAGVYSGFASILLAVAPIVTVGFFMSFFNNISSYFQLLFKCRRDMYVFSELNEKSLTLASDIKMNHPKSVIVFTDVFEKNEEKSYEITVKAKAIGAICFKKDILTVNLRVHKSSKSVYFFIIGTDNAENVVQSMKLIKMYGALPEAHLYVFTTSTESELLLSNNQNTSMKVHRINEVRSFVNRYLYEDGTELFVNAIPVGDNEKKIHAVIVGLGLHGREMFKALTWYCQMDNYRVEIDAYDKDELAGEKLKALCPELLSDDYNGVFIPGEAQYTIRLHPGVDVETSKFAESIGAMKDVTYAFVSVGSDENNINAAVNLRMHFERSGIKPVIQTVINNSYEKSAITEAANYRGQKYNIDCIGDVNSSFTESVIINSELESDALKRHLKWGNEEEFWQYEYNYRSSVASAIHAKARIMCKIPGADKSADELTDEERAVIESVEHRRWNAYMRSEGYIFSGSTDKSSRNDLAKMHNDLVDFSSLSEEEKRKDSRVGIV